MPPRAHKLAPATDLDPDELLAVHGHSVSKVYKVWSGSESDFNYETILYVDGEGRPHTAVVAEGKLVVQNGWKLFDVEEYLG